jgi:glycosyltransferase involved in cell wall biosynthesis
VHNEGRTLRRTLSSILGQTHVDLVVHISDNGSVDDTADICREFAARDARVSFTHHSDVLEAPDNFRFLIDRSRAPYFAFLAGDDWWAPTFADRCLTQLTDHPDAVCCVTRTTFVDDAGAPTRLSDGTAALDADARARLRRYLGAPGDNSRIFGVYRSAVLKEAWHRTPVTVAHDWLVCALTLIEGTHLEWPETLLFREETPYQDYWTLARRWESGVLGRALPNLRMTRVLLANLPPMLRAGLLPTLVAHNFRAMVHSPYAASRLAARAPGKTKARLLKSLRW